MIPRMFCRHGTNTPSSVPSFAAGGGVFFDPGVGLASPSARSESTPCFAVSRTHCVFVVIRVSPVFWKTPCMLTLGAAGVGESQLRRRLEAGRRSGAAPPTPAPASGSSTRVARASFDATSGCANLGALLSTSRRRAQPGRSSRCPVWQARRRALLGQKFWHGAMLTTLAPTLALHASPLPSSLQTALDPVPGAAALVGRATRTALAEERARNSSTQLRCSRRSRRRPTACATRRPPSRCSSRSASASA